MSKDVGEIYVSVLKIIGLIILVICTCLYFVEVDYIKLNFLASFITSIVSISAIFIAIKSLSWSIKSQEENNKLNYNNYLTQNLKYYLDVIDIYKEKSHLLLNEIIILLNYYDNIFVDFYRIMYDSNLKDNVNNMIILELGNTDINYIYFKISNGFELIFNFLDEMNLYLKNINNLMENFKDNTIAFEIINEKFAYEFNSEICYTIYILNSYIHYKYDSEIKTEVKKQNQKLKEKLYTSKIYIDKINGQINIFNSLKFTEKGKK